MKKDVDKIISEMTIAEKALMCVGRDFWYTRGIKRLGLEPYMVTDGPHGLRKQSQSADNLGINDSVKATCFPTACVMASSWDEELIYGVGQRMGEEALDERVSIILGPGANIKRSPLCGRNFEYYSEDPYLAGKCASGLIRGIQSKGIGTSLKHFAVNNQEANRLRIDAIVDERALREIYLKAFEIAVKEAQPSTVMCSYNRINGVFSSNNKKLLNDILREEWGFKGYVMTDWGALDDDIVSCVKNGLDLEMPGGSGESVYKIINAVEEGRLTEEKLNKTVKRLVEFNLKASEKMDFNFVYDRNEHHDFVKKVATEGAVLLKNLDDVLPLNKDEKMLCFGGLFVTPRYQGSGSSLIRPNILVSPKEAFDNNKIDYIYSEGFSATSDCVDGKVLNEALNVAKNSNQNKALVFAGLTMFYESEGFDREHMKLPPNQNALIEALADMGKDVIVILYGGSPVEMPWLDKVKGLINMYLPGQAIGESTLDLLIGNANPSGKLAETYPLVLEDNPSYNHFPEGPYSVEYRESIYVGYRYYCSVGKEVLFPFGYGLSYTKFEYSNLKISNGKKIKVSCDVKNVGGLKGKEVVELYIGAPKDSKIFRAAKELKRFKKVELEVGESKNVVFELNKSDFAYYNVIDKAWTVENGEYPIFVAENCMADNLVGSISLNSDEVNIPYQDEIYDEYKNYLGDVSDEAFYSLIGYKPQAKVNDLGVVNMDNTISEVGVSPLGKMVLKLVDKFTRPKTNADENSKVTANFMRQMVFGLTLRSIANTNGGILSASCVDGLVLAINHHFFKGMHKLIKEFFRNKRLDKEYKKLEILKRKVK